MKLRRSLSSLKTMWSRAFRRAPPLSAKRPRRTLRFTPPTKYLNFELSVDALNEEAFEVGIRGPSGEVHAGLRLPFTREELADHVSRLESAIELSRTTRENESREAASPFRWGEVEAFGGALFNSLLTGPVQQAYRTSLAIARAQGMGLRIQLRFQSPRIAALPWEFMFDQQDDSFVCLNPDTPIVRYPELDQAPRPVLIDLPLRILGMIAAPRDLAPLDVAGECRRIERGIADLKDGKLVELEWVKGGSYRDLQSALLEGQWHVFHYIGHGDFESDGQEGIGVLALEAPVEEKAPVDPCSSSTNRPPMRKLRADILGQQLRGHPSLRLVVLNSCLGARASDADAFSSVAATLVRRGVPAVVAMQYEISDEAALAFAQAFYDSLASGRPVDRAVADARFDLRAAREDSLEWGTPVLLMRSPDGTLFSPEPNHQPIPPNGRPRAPISLIAAGAALPLIAAALLSLWRVPGADVSIAGAQVTGVGVTLPTQRALADPIEVTKLGISGLKSIILSTSAEGRRTLNTEKLQLTALPEPDHPGRMTLNLSSIVPKGTGISLAVSDEPGSYVLKLDSIRDLTVPTSGPVRVLVPGALDERVDFQESGAVWLRSRGRLVRLEFTPAEGTRNPFIEGLPAHGLNLVRIDPYVTGDRTEMRQVSTIRSGRIKVAGAWERPLERGEFLHTAGVSGQITRLDLAGDHLRLDLTAHVDTLSTGPDTARSSLMPTRLGWVASKYGWWVTGAMGLYLVLLTLAVRHWTRRAP
jgi:hypothetical protein